MRKLKFGFVICLVVTILMTSCQPAQPAQPAAGEEPAAPEEIVIGVYEPMTGAQAAGGELTMQGVNLAHEQHKEVLGTPIRLVLVDNRSDKAESATAMTRLIEQEGAIAVIGSYGSSNSMAGGEVSEKAGIPVMGCSPTNPLVTTDKEYYFRACFIDPFQGRVMAKYAYETLNAEKVAIIQDVAQDYSVGLAAFFKQSWKDLTGQRRWHCCRDLLPDRRPGLHRAVRLGTG